MSNKKADEKLTCHLYDIIRNTPSRVNLNVMPPYLKVPSRGVSAEKIKQAASP